MRSFIGGFAAAIALLALVAFGAVETGAVPANADRGPLPMERWAARTSLNATLERVSAKSEVAPPSDDDLKSGAVLYVQNCAVCHGTAHSNPTAIAQGFYIRAPQFNKRGVDDDPVGETFWKIDHGIAWTAMPAYDRALDQREIWQLAWFLKNQPHLPAAAAAIWENPRLAPAATPAPAASLAPQSRPAL